MPLVASEACCRNDDEPARERISIGIARRCAAKMVFINGIYCVGLAVETLTTRIRDVSVGEAFRELFAAAVEEVVGERSVVCLLMYVRARVSAPARAVVGVEREVGVVVARRVVREAKRAREIWWKGR